MCFVFVALASAAADSVYHVPLIFTSLSVSFVSRSGSLRVLSHSHAYTRLSLSFSLFLARRNDDGVQRGLSQSAQIFERHTSIPGSFRVRQVEGAEYIQACLFEGKRAIQTMSTKRVGSDKGIAKLSRTKRSYQRRSA